MNKKIKSIISIAAASALCMSIASSVSASTPGTETNKAIVTGSKTLKVISLTDTANIEFTLAAASGEDLAPVRNDTSTSASMQYFPGIMDGVKGPDGYSNGTFTLTFNPDTDTAYTMTGDDEYVYYRQGFEFDFSEVQWTNGAGMYVYTIEESNDGGYDLYKGEDGYKIYVYVQNKVNESGEFVDADGKPLEEGQAPVTEVGGVVVTNPDGDKNGLNPEEDDIDKFEPVPGTGDDSSDGDGGGSGSGGGSIDSKGDFDFWNEENANVLTLSKTVKGNQASTDEEFAFTIRLTGEAGTYNITGDIDGDAEAEETGSKTIKIDATGGSGTGTIYLKHGEEAKIYIPEGMAWEIVENPEGYTPTATGDGEVDGATITGNMGAAAQNVAYTNTLSGTIPTGVLLTIAPFGALMLVGLGGLIAVSRKKKEEE